MTEGQNEGRRKDLNGEQSTGAAGRFQQALGDGWRISGPIVGSDQFAAKVLEDIVSHDQQAARLSGKVKVGRGVERPSLKEVIGVTCAVVGVEPWEFEQQPKIRRSVLARQVITWLWVQSYGGKQIEIARELDAKTSAVSRWYGRAVQQIVELEPYCDEVQSKFPTLLSQDGGRSKVVYGFEYDE